MNSIFSQNYPKDKLEVFVIDKGSTDGTVENAKKYPVKIMYDKEGNCETAKNIGLKNATGDLFMFIDADEELPGTEWFNYMIKPMLKNKKIVGSFSKFHQHPKYSPITRFITYDELQGDPLLEFLVPKVSKVVAEQKEGYSLCKIKYDKIPQIGRCLLRREALLSIGMLEQKSYFDVEVISMLVNKGFDTFAYVPQAGYYHFHAKGVKELIRKRVRNIKIGLLPNMAWRRYTWLNPNSPGQVLSFFLWLIYTHTLILSMLRGVYKAIKHKDVYCIFYEPILSLLVTDAILITLIAPKNLLTVIKRVFIKANV